MPRAMWASVRCGQMIVDSLFSFLSAIDWIWYLSTSGDRAGLHANCALLVIRLARYRIEGALRDLVGVALSEMKWQEYLTRSDDLRDAELHLADTSAG